MSPKPTLGRDLIWALHEAGIVPVGTRKVIIEADLDSYVRIITDATDTSMELTVELTRVVVEREVFHGIPTNEANGRTPCCGRSPSELPRRDRLTTNGDLITCGGPS